MDGGIVLSQKQARSCLYIIRPIVGFTSSLGAILWEVENTLELYFKK
jgi:hypothetical protein